MTTIVVSKAWWVPMMKKVEPTRKPMPFHHCPFFQSEPNHLDRP
jgi:hypothetical protein